MNINFDDLISSLLICKDANTELIKDNPRQAIDSCICDSIGVYSPSDKYPYESYESFELEMAVGELIRYIVYMGHHDSSEEISKGLFDLILKVRDLNNELSELI